MLNREQDFDVTAPMLHHDTFVGSVVEALALSQHRIFEVMGLVALYNTTPLRISLLHANLTDLKLRICKSSLQHLLLEEADRSAVGHLRQKA